MVINAKVIKTKKKQIKKSKILKKSSKSGKNIYLDILSNTPFILSYTLFTVYVFL